MRPYLEEMRYSALVFKFRNETLYEVNGFHLQEEIAKTKEWFGHYRQRTTCPEDIKSIWEVTL